MIKELELWIHSYDDYEALDDELWAQSKYKATKDGDDDDSDDDEDDEDATDTTDEDEEVEEEVEEVEEEIEEDEVVEDEDEDYEIDEDGNRVWIESERRLQNTAQIDNPNDNGNNVLITKDS